MRLDRDNATALLVDRQASLFFLVQGVDPDKFENNVPMLGSLAEYFNPPTILTTSFETGPDGPLVLELKARFLDAPYIAHPGDINTQDNENFVKVVKTTGGKRLIIADIVAEVCAVSPVLSVIKEDLDVFIVTNTSGTFSEIIRHSAWDRMSQAGVQLMTWFGVAYELHRDWRDSIEGPTTLFSDHISDYHSLITSYDTLAKQR